MANVVIYSTEICPYCNRAKSLLQDKGVEYEEIDISSNHNQLAEMVEKSGGRRTVPQIFIDENHVGGFDDLYMLDKQGKLDEMLSK